MGSAVIKKDR